MPVEGMRGGGANSEEAKDRGLRRGSKEGPRSGRWSWSVVGSWARARGVARGFSAGRWPNLTSVPPTFVALRISPVLRSLSPGNMSPSPPSFTLK